MTSDLKTGLQPSDSAVEALILLDLQVDFLSETGRLPIDQGQVPGLLAAAKRAVERARAAGWPIVAVGNEFRKQDFVLNVFQNFASMQGSAGAAWDPRAPAERDAYFPKRVADSFSNPELEPWLRAHGVTRVRIVGLQAKACVGATAKGAMRRGFGVVLAKSEVGCVSEGSRERSLRRLARAGAVVEPS